MTAVKKSSRRRSGPVDVHVGRNIQAHRRASGLSQHVLATHLGITVQQLHKYEAGNNRIAASRLYEIAQLLGIGIGALFAGLDHAAPMETDVDWSVAIAFNRITCPVRRRALFALVHSLADDPADIRR